MNDLTPAGAPGDLRVRRDQHGVLHVRAQAEADRYWGLGYAHGLDRGLQTVMMRILGQGRACEFLDPDLLDVDLFFRRMHWSGGAAEEVAAMTAESRGLVQAYCDGLNARLDRRRPWELRMTSYRHEAWTPGDCMMLARMTGYLTLAQSQAEVERLVVEMVQADVPDAHLEELFPGLLHGLDRELIQEVRLGERVVPEALRWLGGLSPAMASNNWVVAGSKTRSGRAMLANDPHLEVNRLPNVWYEVVVEGVDDATVALTMAGLPALLIGRTKRLAWGATYAFIDAVDSWVERCRGGAYLRGEDWLPFRERREAIKRRGRACHEVVFYENDHGVLDGDPHEEGCYLTTRWAPSRAGARSMEAVLAVSRATTAAEGMAAMGPLEPAFSWVFADSAGDIGFQMSGLAPRRREGVSGLVPLPGWDPANDWRGFLTPEELPRCVNPAEGFIVTANQDLNHLGEGTPINMPMGDYRAQRIAEVLGASDSLDVDAMAALQMDLTSPQADALLEVLEPLLPDTPCGRALRTWDRRYDVDSEGAWLFERLYEGLLVGVFGQGFGEPVVRFLMEETGAFTDFYANLDQILLAEESVWFGGQPRDALYRAIAADVLDLTPQRWGDRQRIVMRHMLFGDKLPRWLGFDRGPLELPGGRGTPHQGQVYRSGGRTTSFAPSMRLVVDFAEEGAWTRLCGGPSDRRFSRWYVSELQEWLKGTLKRVRPDGTA